MVVLFVFVRSPNVLSESCLPFLLLSTSLPILRASIRSLHPIHHHAQRPYLSSVVLGGRGHRKRTVQIATMADKKTRDFLRVHLLQQNSTEGQRARRTPDMTSRFTNPRKRTTNTPVTPAARSRSRYAARRGGQQKPNPKDTEIKVLYQLYELEVKSS